MSNLWGFPWDHHPPFFECPRVRHRWLVLLRETRNTQMDINNCTSLVYVILLAIARQRRCPTLTLLVAETIFLIWNERNALVFRGKWSTAPLALIWRQVAINLEAILCRVTNPQISRVISKDITLIRSFFDNPSVRGDLPLDYDSLVLVCYICAIRFPVGGGRVSFPGDAPGLLGGWFSPLFFQ